MGLSGDPLYTEESGQGERVEGIRMVIGRLAIRLQEEIIKRAAESEPGIELVGSGVSLREIRRLVKGRAANVAVVQAEDHQIRTAWDLLHRRSDLIVVGIGDDGRRFTFCAPNLDADQLIRVVRVLRNPGPGDHSGREP